MNRLRCIVILEFATALALGQAGHWSKPADLSEQPKTLVSNLYKEVVARHPRGIPEGADMKIFAPYLSKALQHKIDAANACYHDWIRQHPDSNLKAPFNWFESGFFSGDDEKASPSAFQIEKTQSEKDGSFRVYVRLTLEKPPPEIWQVAAVMVQENGHFVVDDVIYLNDENRLVELRLSEYLFAGCDGSRWVGFRDQQKDQKQQKK